MYIIAHCSIGRRNRRMPASHKTPTIQTWSITERVKELIAIKTSTKVIWQWGGTASFLFARWQQQFAIARFGCGVRRRNLSLPGT